MELNLKYKPLNLGQGLPEDLVPQEVILSLLHSGTLPLLLVVNPPLLHVVTLPLLIVVALPLLHVVILSLLYFGTLPLLMS